MFVTKIIRITLCSYTFHVHTYMHAESSFIFQFLSLFLFLLLILIFYSSIPSQMKASPLSICFAFKFSYSIFKTSNFHQTISTFHFIRSTNIKHQVSIKAGKKRAFFFLSVYNRQNFLFERISKKNPYQD